MNQAASRLTDKKATQFSKPYDGGQELMMSSGLYVYIRTHYYTLPNAQIHGNFVSIKNTRKRYELFEKPPTKTIKKFKFGTLISEEIVNN